MLRAISLISGLVQVMFSLLLSKSFNRKIRLYTAGWSRARKKCTDRNPADRALAEGTLAEPPPPGDSPRRIVLA